MDRCVNCGLYGGKKQILPKVVKSIVGETYFKILLCIHCHPKEHFICEYGYKSEITADEAKKYLDVNVAKALQ